MIDGYKCRDGKVVVINYDEDNNRYEEERVYQDNIEELLMAENVEEYLLSYRDDMNTLINTKKDEIKQWKEERTCRKVVIAVVAVVLSVLFAIFKPMSFVGVVLLASGFYGKFVSECTRIIKELESEIDGAKLTLEGIKEQLEENRVELRRLENDDRIVKEDISSEYKQLNYVEELKKLKRYLELWYVAGMNEKKFLKYIENQELSENISDDFPNEEVRIVRRILTDRVKKRY